MNAEPQNQSESKKIHARKIFEEGKQKHFSNNLIEAESLYQEALSLDPSLSEAHHLIGLIALQVDKPAVAKEWFQTSISLEPENPVYLANLATAQYSLGNLDEAEKHYLEALEKEPNYAEAHNNLGILLKEQGHVERSKSYLEKAIELRPDYAPFFCDLAELFIEEGDYTTGEKLARACVNLDHNYEPGLTALATSQEHLGFANEAAETRRILDQMTSK